MPLPKPNLYPDFNIVRLSHVELEVKDLAASRAFYVDTLGLLPTFESASTLCLRGLEERGHHCMVLKQGSSPQAHVLGFKVFDEPDLDKAEAWFNSRGRKTAWVERPFVVPGTKQAENLVAERMGE